ncbi:MAG: hypothetical protein QW760_04805 [Thermofilaceae archaeon]
MNNEMVIVWLLRLTSLALVLAPQAYYYVTSESLNDFFIPDLVSTSLEFDPRSVNVILDDYGVLDGNVCLLRVRVFNSGSMSVGLKDVDAMVLAPSGDFSGKVALQPFTVEPGEEKLVNVELLLEKGVCENLPEFFSKSSARFSGDATLVLGSAELPLSFSVDLGPGGG